MKRDFPCSPHNCEPERRKSPPPIQFKRPADTEGGDHD